MHGRSLRKINDEIEELCLYGIDVPDEEIEGETGLLTPVEVDMDDIHENYLHDKLDELDIERTEKIEQIGKFLLNNNADIEELDKEIKKLRKWKSQLEKRGIWLKWYCMTEMIRAGITKLTGKFIKMSVNKSRTSATYPTKPGTKEPIVDLIDPKYVREEISYKVDASQALRDYKQHENPIRGFTFHENNTHLRVK